MPRHYHHRGGRRLLLAVLLAGAFWSGVAQAQTSEADVAQAELEVAEARLVVAEAKLKRIKAGSSGSKAATDAPAPKTTPELGQSESAAEGKEADNGTEPPAKGKPAKPDKTEATEEAKAAAAGRQKFGGLEFGVGISFTRDVGANDRINEAELVNGIVRVKDEDNGRARIMLESHYFFKPCSKVVKGKTCTLPFGIEAGDFGWGPFIALQPGTDNIIDAVAIGGMVGFRRPGPGTESFNLGLGFVIDPNTRILGDGIIANQPLPQGETAVRYKEKMQTGLLVLASFGF